MSATATATIEKVLVANRGEIAVRVIRGARDAGIPSVAVYADPDADAPFVSLADEAIALHGSTGAETYLNVEKLLKAAAATGANAIHPGYGFLSENADFAQAVIDAGYIWIGPPPEAIRDLGDKVTARHIAERANAPMAAGTKNPVKDANEVVAFAKKYGCPIAIKAAFGGGGRGMKVAHTIEEIPELFDSATREATAAFGRGECFVEQYLDHARHVEAQVLADQHGNVIVVGTRDCTLQRRFQKLVEEAPAPFLTAEQEERIRSSARAICRESGYYGAGTVEYMVQGDTISFLEVNTRLQVEHPVTEETTNLDLVLRQFAIAEGKELDIKEDPTPVGHAFEFRINGEDPGRNFLPAPGTVIRYEEPTGPGVRVDSGVREGDIVGGEFDSMLAKLIMWGETRENALARARRALSEYHIEGLATTLDFHRHIVSNPDFVGDSNGFNVFTKWIENEWKNPFDAAVEDPDAPQMERLPNRIVVVEVDGKRMEVSLPADFVVRGSRPAKVRKPRPRTFASNAGSSASGDTIIAPMQGTVVKVAVEEGQVVKEGDLVIVLEAMKMENPVLAHQSGTITQLSVEPGTPVTPGTAMCKILQDNGE
ncbi:biotin carboxylase N-terminal domain-containing protein [Lawsonella clevelandensis]|uniref:Biotin-dependent acyl-coenzyme A carboxylase alpha3 subunit n=1 Tax=Lawsonella clevelandensis TaxID=1528099 RepID=A0A2W5IAV5_9ACTN|nr:biotin carboxylase N-terminal domain-containing protein [Lawsonella clevelandensis]PZP89255.1 MAG: acetyl-/propionyl-CoA carboxylase subunit alpha [Lawsonella clevelandensis]